MDQPTNLEGEGSAEKFLHIPYDQRWELLKLTIVRIYMEENNKLVQLARRMKDEYSFDAQLVHLVSPAIVFHCWLTPF